MFKVKDKVVYPMHGVGVITNIEKRKFINELKQYYTIDLIHDDMRIMISTDKISNSNLRKLTPSSTVDDVLTSINDYDISESSEKLIQKERYKINLEKMKSGSFKKCLELIRDLTHINNNKPLNSNEMKMLSTTRKHITDEIALVKNISERQADALITAKIS